jgi:hypothetical protein
MQVSKELFHCLRYLTYTASAKAEAILDGSSRDRVKLPVPQNIRKMEVRACYVSGDTYVYMCLSNVLVSVFVCVHSCEYATLPLRTQRAPFCARTQEEDEKKRMKEKRELEASGMDLRLVPKAELEQGSGPVLSAMLQWSITPSSVAHTHIPHPPFPPLPVLPYMETRSITYKHTHTLTHAYKHTHTRFYSTGCGPSRVSAAVGGTQARTSSS